MVAPAGRRERKKAATHRHIASTALDLFLERGYDAVGVREVAEEADVAVTTLFAHFASKEALVFEHDQDFEERLVHAVMEWDLNDALIPLLHHEIDALVEQCRTREAISVWKLIDDTPALQNYERSMRARHAEAVAEAIAVRAGLPKTPVRYRAIARFVIDAFTLGREADDPRAAVDEVFLMISAAWEGLPRVNYQTPRKNGR